MMTKPDGWSLLNNEELEMHSEDLQEGATLVEVAYDQYRNLQQTLAPILEQQADLHRQLQSTKQQMELRESLKLVQVK